MPKETPCLCTRTRLSSLQQASEPKLTRLIGVFWLIFFLSTGNFALTQGAVPTINGVDPEKWFPSQFVKINCSWDTTPPDYSDLRIFAGGRELVVLSVSEPGLLIVRAPVSMETVSPLQLFSVPDGSWYNVSVNVSMVSPDVDIGELHVGVHGPPRTFPGNNPCCPLTNAKKKKRIVSSNGTNQILLINVYGSDTGPGSATWISFSNRSAADERTNQANIVNRLTAPWVSQASWGKQAYVFTVTDFLALPETADHYFWTPADIASATTLDDVNTATANQDLAQRAGDLFYDSVKAAKDAGVAVNTFDGIMINFAYSFLRGQSFGTFNSVQEDRGSGRSVSLKSQTNMWYVSFISHWCRRVHELSHSILSGDIYNAAGVISTGAQWDIMGSHNTCQLPSSYNMLTKAGWIDAGNVVELGYTADYPMDRTYTIVAHGDTQNPSGDSVYHVIHITVFPGLEYFVEVRQEPISVPVELSGSSDSLAEASTASNFLASHSGQTLFDTHIFSANSETNTSRAGVLVTQVSTVVPEDTNQQHRLITKLGDDKLLVPGSQVSDPSNNLVVQVISQTASRPARFSVRIFWSSAAVSDPQGLFNLRIREWVAPPYLTKDIWVDSSKNGFDTYENPLESITSDPTNGGDRPWVGHDNRLGANIWNDGVEDATGVQVVFYINSPPGIGDNGDWVPHASRFLNMAKGTFQHVPNPPSWWPVIDRHTCLKVQIANYIGETTAVDNVAHENVFNFIAAGASPRVPVFMTVSVKNPRNDSAALLFVRPRHLPRYWEAVVEHAWLYLGPLESQEMSVAVFTDVGRVDPVGLDPLVDLPLPKSGACCNDSAGSCTENVPPPNCLRSNGLYFFLGKSCKDILCGKGACCTSQQCLEISSADCVVQKGIFTPHVRCSNSTCLGSCCLYSPSANGQMCQNLETVAAGRCPPNGYYRPMETCQTPCPELNPQIDFVGLIRHWFDQVSVKYNTRRAECLGEMGGITVSIAARHKLTCTSLSVLDNCVRACFTQASGTSTAPVPFVLEIVDDKGKTVCVTNGTTTVAANSLVSCATLCSPCGSPLSTLSPGHTLTISASSMESPFLSTGVCSPISVQCPATGGLCVTSPDLGCSYNPATGACKTNVCPFDATRQCVLIKREGQAPFCVCDPTPVSLCRLNSATDDTCLGSCPQNRPCALYKDPAGKPFCDCPPPDDTPCAFNRATGACFRPDCPFDNTKKCIRIPNTEKCECQGSLPVPCDFNPVTKQCYRQDCPKDPSRKCLLLPNNRCECQPKVIDCVYNPLTGFCARQDCPNDPTKKCVRIPGTTICHCDSSLPCAFNQTGQRCTRPDCPTDPARRCLPVPGSALCQCEPQPVECAYSAATNQCTRPDCPNDPTRKCVMVTLAAGTRTCQCKSAVPPDNCVCARDPVSGLCTREDCPNKPGYICRLVKYPLSTSATGIKCACVGQTAPGAAAGNFTNISLALGEKSPVSFFVPLTPTPVCHVCYDRTQMSSHSVVPPSVRVMATGQGDVCAVLALSNGPDFVPFVPQMPANLTFRASSFFDVFFSVPSIAFFDVFLDDLALVDFVRVPAGMSAMLGGSNHIFKLNNFNDRPGLFFDVYLVGCDSDSRSMADVMIMDLGSNMLLNPKLRGDANDDGLVDLRDVVTVLDGWSGSQKK